MKKILTPIVGILALVSVGAYAADQTTTTTTSTSSSPSNKIEKWFDDVTGPYYQDLELTPAQKTQLRDIHQKHRLAEEKEVKAVLTPTQQQKWEELKTSRRDAYLDKNEKSLQK